MTEPTIDLSPSSVPTNNSPDSIQVTLLTISVANPASTPLDAAGGISFEFYVDPGQGDVSLDAGVGSDGALLLSNYSFEIPAGQPALTAQPAVTAQVTQAPHWGIQLVSEAPCTFLATSDNPSDLTVSSIPANGSFTFTFYVAGDPVPGGSTINVAVTSSTGAATSLQAQVLKVQAAPSVAGFPVAQQLGMPSNQANLTWTVYDADSCSLGWPLNADATVSYYQDGEQNPVPNPWPGAPVKAAGQAVTATVTQQVVFTLSVPADSPTMSVTQTVSLTQPRFIILCLPPAVSALLPITGDPAGGQQVTIFGSGFTDATAVSFGTAACTSFSRDSDTQITATAPPGTGVVDVTVSTPGGTSAITRVDQYTYAAAGVPVVTGVSPNYGGPADPQQVTITGIALDTADEVAFGGATIGKAAITVNGDGSLTVAAPPGAAGSTVDVTVHTAAGTSPGTALNWYCYVPVGVPVMAWAQPPAGDPAGGEPVMIDGTTGLLDATAVHFGTATTTAIIRNDADGTISVPTPPGTAGSTVDVTVTTPAGTSPVFPSMTYSYATAVETIAPHQRFRLVWSCYDGSGPHLGWTGAGNVYVTLESGAQVDPGGSLPASQGWALAQIDNAANFEVTQASPIGGPTTVGSITIDMAVLTPVTSLAVSSVTTDPGSGTQTAVLTWQVANATGFVVVGGLGPYFPAYNESSQPVTLPQPLAPTTYTLDAFGYQGTGGPFQPEQVTVTPNAVQLDSVGVSQVQVDAGSGQQSVLVSWLAANITGVTITGGAATVSRQPLESPAQVFLPGPPAPPGPVSYQLTFTADGYQPATETLTVVPDPVGQPFLNASSRTITMGQSVTLSWGAANATGYQLAGTDGTKLSFTAGQTSTTLNPLFTTSYTVTAEGYPGGAQLPMTPPLRVAVSKGHKDKDKDKDKDGHHEKNVLPEQPVVRPLPGGAAGPGDLAPPGTTEAGGTQQPFIGADERPDVGAHLRDDGGQR